MTHHNPLQQYFRQPGRSILLPSRGYYNKPEDIEFELNGEVKIYPMTNQDAINLANPDNLLNGSALRDLIKSCCPNIKNIKELCVVDSDAILVAIKMASSSNSYDITYECPHCGEKNDLHIDLGNIIDNLTSLPEEMSVRLTDDLVVNLRPYTMDDNAKLTDAEYQESFTLKMIQAHTGLSEENRTKAINDSIMKIVRIRSGLIKNAIMSITTPTETVTDKEFIEEFLNNVPKNFVQKINEKMNEISKLGLPEYTKHVCGSCKKDMEVPFMFDPASFLG